jgi:hypothetical protein
LTIRIKSALFGGFLLASSACCCCAALSAAEFILYSSWEKEKEKVKIENKNREGKEGPWAGGKWPNGQQGMNAASNGRSFGLAAPRGNEQIC